MSDDDSPRIGSRTGPSRYASRRRFLQTAALVGGAGVAGCVGGSNLGGGGGGGVDPSEIDLDEIEPDGPVGKGPTGAEPQPTSTLELTDEEVQEAREMDITMPVVFQYLKSDWVRLVRKGMQSKFIDYDITTEGVYGVDFQADQQVDLLETLASKADQIDAAVIYPVDPTAVVEPIRTLRENDVEVVIITNTPPEFNHPEDFAGMVTVDNYGLGLIAGRLLERMVGSGKVGMIELEPQLYVIDEREKAVRKVLEEEADDIELVTNSFNDANETFDLTQNMLTANPDMQGLWSPWATPPANEAVAAINESGGDDLVHTTVDLNQQQAEIMAREGPTKGIAVGDPFGIGENLIKMAVNAILGNETPAYVSVGTNAVVRDNLLQMYETTLHEEPPESVTQHFEDS